MGYLRGLCLCICVFALTVSSSSFGAYLAEEFVNSSAQIKKTSDFLHDASNADLISVGETHGKGAERQVLHDMYQKLFGKFNGKPTCLVEDFNMLLHSRGYRYSTF